MNLFDKIFENHRFRETLFLLFWTLLIVYLVANEIISERQYFYDQALLQAKNGSDYDLLYKKWVSINGGIYVPISDFTKPNPYLKINNRDVETTDGQKLTLVNPAYMTRMVHAISDTTLNTRLISLKPLNPINKPDEFERKALLKFEKGIKEIHSLQEVYGKKYLRFVAAFITESECLKCHAQQGYKVGDIRGGISVSVDYAKYDRMISETIISEFITHSIIWLVGLISIFLFLKILRKSELKGKSEKDKLSNILNFLPSSVVIHKDDKILYYNPAAFAFINADETVDSSKIKFSDLIAKKHREKFRDRIKRMFAGKEITGSEIYSINSFEGISKEVEVYSRLMEYDGQNAIITVANDISKLRKALIESEENKSQMEAVLKAMPDLVFIFNRDGKVIDIKNNTDENLIQTKEELIGKNLIEILPYEIASISMLKLNALFESGNLQIHNYSLLISGIQKYFEARFVKMDEEHSLVVVRETTQEKVATEKERVKNEQYQLLFRASPFAISITRMMDGKYLEVNEAFEKLSGFLNEKVAGKTSTELGFWISPDDRKNFIQDLLVNGCQRNFEQKFKIRNDKIITCLVNSDIIIINNEEYLISIIEDITEKKAIDYRNQKEEERNKILASLHNKSFDLTEKELFDYTLEQLVLLTDSKIGFAHNYDEATNTINLTTWNSSTREVCSAIFEQHYPLEVAGNWADCIRQRKGMIYNNYKNSPNQKGLPDGHVELERFMSVPGIIEGSVKLVFGVGNKESDYSDFDMRNIQIVINELSKIIERKIIENELRNREIELTSLLNSQTTYIIKTDLEGKYTFCNIKFYETFSWIFDDGIILGKPSLETIYFEDRQKCIETVEKCFASPEETFRIELRKPFNHEKQRHTMWDFVCKLGEDGKPKEMLCIGVDITEKKQAEMQIGTQLKFTNALNEISDIILSGENENLILGNINEIIGVVLNVDRSLIYNVDSGKQLVIGLFEKLSDEEIPPSIGTYPLDYFRAGYESMLETSEALLSDFDKINPILLKDGSAEILHNQMQIKSLLWIPFGKKENDLSVLVLNQVTNKKIWASEELLFLYNAVNQINLAFQKIYLSKNLIESEHKFRSVFEDSSAIKMIIDIQNEKIINSNAAAENFYLYPTKELKSLNIFEAEILPADFKPILLSKSKNYYETPTKLADGSYRTVQLFLAKVKINSSELLHVILNDISDKAAKEKELRNYREHLEELVEARTKELEKLNRKLNEKLEYQFELENKLKGSLEKEKEASQLKNKFIATVSHEFRTPLSTMLSSVQLIQKYSNKWSEEKLEEHYRQIDDKVKYLTQLLDDILTISRSEREILKFNPVKINLVELLQSSINDIQASETEKYKIIFNNNLTEQIFTVDPKLIRHISSNLIVNAIKYSSEGSKVEISICENETNLFFTVKDEGVGISKDEIKYIFEPFFRTNSSVGIQGSGLGLNIVKRCVDLMQGDIKVESEEGKGSLFEITFPKLI